MHVKFIAHGTGSAGVAADYLLGERDAAGQPCADVEVLRGDPEQVAAIADSLEFDHKYRSAVIAWAPEDRPTDAQIEAVLDEFEKTAWAGLEPDRYSWTAVLHREQGGGVHVHVLTARCDLETGKSLNIAPPGWRQTFGPLRDAFNHERGWSRPDDPARARAQQSGHRAYIEAATLRTGLEHEADPRELIRDYLTQRVEHGAVQSRADVVAALEEARLEVPRQGKSYVTVRNPDDGKRWRLKGELYEHDFEPGRLDLQAPAPARDRADGDRGDGRARAEGAWRELESRREQRAACHRSRYGGVDRTDSRDAPAGVALAAGGRPESLSRHLRRELGGDALAVDGHRVEGRDAGRVERGHRAGPPDADRDRGDDLWVGADGDRRGAVRRAAGGLATQSALDRGRAGGLEAVERVRELYDRVRTAVDESLAGVVRAVRAGADAARRADRDLAAAGRVLRRAGDAIDRGLQGARRDVARALALMRQPGQQRGPERDHGPSRQLAGAGDSTLEPERIPSSTLGPPASRRASGIKR